MVSSAVRSTILRGSTVRHYAAVAAAAQSCGPAVPECKVLSNKVTIAAYDNNSPITQVSIIFRAGSRNETYDTQGMIHHLRVLAGQSTSRASGFAITRNIQQLGGNLLTVVDRESIAYTLQITRNNLNDALKFLDCVATKQVFKPWEVSDQAPRLQYELQSIPDTTRVLELLHKAAFRRGLGYSLFSPKHQIGKIGTETLQHFVNSWYTAPKCAVVAVGVPLSHITAFASNLEISSEDCANEASKYHGGEIRKEKGSNLTNVAVAVEGVNMKNEKDALACAILQRASSTDPRVKWGNSSSPLYKQVANAAGTDPFALSTFNANYTDSGLFGFVLCSTPDIAGPLTKEASKWLKSMKLSDKDIARGKAILKAEILDAADNESMLLENMQYQALFKGQISTPATLMADVDKVSASDVQSVAAKLSKGNLSMAAVGNLKTVPYIDELK
ncbi:ubiquinol-cytochrome c reductase core protein 2 [Megachile rotundata]|uniref:ubiquinol-cytochrome c reductase core protein 2 n=1 Tax=Megachile rotundata TaxID=143995 RepID=UPI000258E007|nr:PREDICTED: cytochrome b-c1 complex subunit 2, mitochondrial [Megachile rotundata]